MLSGRERSSDIDDLAGQSQTSDHFECAFTTLDLQS